MRAQTFYLVRFRCVVRHESESVWRSARGAIHSTGYIGCLSQRVAVLWVFVGAFNISVTTSRRTSVTDCRKFPCEEQIHSGRIRPTQSRALDVASFGRIFISFETYEEQTPRLVQ